MILEKYQYGLEESNSYLVIENNKAIVVDAPDIDIINVLRERKLNLEFIILTHEHVDHLWGLNEIRKEYPCKIISHEICGKAIQDCRENKARGYHTYYALKYKKPIPEKMMANYKCCGADLTFKDIYDMDWYGNKFHMVYAPGHSAGSILIVLNNMILFSGDNVIQNQLAFTAFEGGDDEAMRKITLPYIKTLNEEMNVMPGHGNSFQLKNWSH